jgi:serine/threonine protein kinase
MSELEGTTIDHYHITCQLAQGGMSEIYLAQDRVENRMVAIKMVHNSNREYYERFHHEVQKMSSLQHEHILPVLDYGEYESWYYLITPYISYGTLVDRLALGALSLKEAGEILEQLGNALQFTHERGIVHRDIKPSNVLLRDGEHVYLADFGLAKKVGEDKSFTLAGIMMGTPDYMAPELAEEPASPRSDIYALGVLLYQMLTSKVPFSASTPLAVFSKHVSEQPQRPSVYNATIPVAVEKVILHALQKDPRRRFSASADLIAAYRQALVGEMPYQPGLTECATFVPLQIERSRLLSRQQQKSRSLTPLVAIGIVGLLLLLPLSIGLTYYGTPTSASTLPQVSPTTIVPVTPVTPHTGTPGTSKRTTNWITNPGAQIKYDEGLGQEVGQQDDDKHIIDSNAPTWGSQNNNDNGQNNGKGGEGDQNGKSDGQGYGKQ